MDLFRPSMGAIRAHDEERTFPVLREYIDITNPLSMVVDRYYRLNKESISIKGTPFLSSNGLNISCQR
jgi:hypothetical protein